MASPQEMIAQQMGGDFTNPTADDGFSDFTTEYGSTDEGDNGNTPTQIKIAQRFIELVGGAEKARELIDKCEQCADCLDLVDDSDIINGIADATPDEPDHPTNLSSFAITGLYNPTSIVRDVV